MKKALIFRTAQAHIVCSLLEKLQRKNYKIWCVVQDSSLESLRSKFPNVKYITVPDGFFDYRSFRTNKLVLKQIKQAKCTRVFVPSSTYDFIDFLEVRRIIYSLGFRKITYFVFYGKAVTMDLSLSEIWFEMLIKSSVFMDFLVLLSNLVSFAFYIKGKFLKLAGGCEKR